jgi:arylsulfatase A-like enzyme
MALLRSQYYACVEETDAQLGRLFDELRHSGELQRTLVLFTTDHGEQLGDHWLLNKDGFFE